VKFSRLTASSDIGANGLNFERSRSQGEPWGPVFTPYIFTLFKVELSKFGYNPSSGAEDSTLLTPKTQDHVLGLLCRRGACGIYRVLF